MVDPTTFETEDKANIRAEIATARRAQQRRTRITADKALREVARVAFSDIGDLFDDEGRLLETRRVPLETRALASVKVSRERTTRRVTRAGRSTTTETVRECVIEYRFANKLEAIGKLFNYLGLAASVPPLEVLLLSLPPALAAELREAGARPVDPSISRCRARVAMFGGIRLLRPLIHPNRTRHGATERGPLSARDAELLKTHLVKRREFLLGQKELPGERR